MSKVQCGCWTLPDRYVKLTVWLLVAGGNNGQANGAAAGVGKQKIHGLVSCHAAWSLTSATDKGLYMVGRVPL